MKLPFEHLSPDEFEVFSFLLLLRERDALPDPAVALFYYGKTRDRGRDIIRQTASETLLIQCKHSGGNVGVAEIRAELAKLFINVYEKAIERPDAIEFCVSTDLTGDAQDLLRSWDVWDASSAKALTEHLRGEPPSLDLLESTRTWHPRLSWQTGLLLTERARKPSAVSLIDEFFEIQKVVDERNVTQRLDALDRKLDLLLASSETSDIKNPRRDALVDFLAKYKKLMATDRGFTLSQLGILNGLVDLVAWQRAQRGGALKQLQDLEVERKRLWAHVDTATFIGSTPDLRDAFQQLDTNPQERARQLEAWRRWTDLLKQHPRGPQNDTEVAVIREAGVDMLNANIQARSVKVKQLEGVITRLLLEDAGP